MTAVEVKEANPEEVLLWVDVETTGLSPQYSHLLQVAAIVTDLEGNELAAPFNRVVHYERATDFPLSECRDLREFCLMAEPNRDLGLDLYGDFRSGRKAPTVETLYAEANNFVRDMHDKTNLWERLHGDDALPLEAVDAELYAYVKLYAPHEQQARLAGNSVRLDLNFLEAFLPETYSHLHYRSVDVSALAYVLVDAWGFVEKDFDKKKTHDALDDIRESLAEFKYFKARLEELR